MSGPNTPNSSQTTAPPNSPISGNPLALPERLRAAIAAKNARKAADQLEIEAEQVRRDMRRLMSRDSLESLRPETAETIAILLRPPPPSQGVRDPEATEIPAMLARKIQLADVRDELERAEWEKQELAKRVAVAGPVISAASGEASDEEDAASLVVEGDAPSEGKRDRIRRVGKGLLRRMSSLKPMPSKPHGREK